MSNTATLTSKRQLTIPQEAIVWLAVKKNQKFNIAIDRGRLILTPIDTIIENLAGSLTPIRDWKNESTDEIITSAKKDYLLKKYNDLHRH